MSQMSCRIRSGIAILHKYTENHLQDLFIYAENEYVSWNVGTVVHLPMIYLTATNNIKISDNCQLL